MRLSELRIRTGVALRRRIPGGRSVQRRLVREDLRDFRRLHPVSESFGFDRGTPIERYYIERFLDLHRPDVAGRCLEIGDAHYTRRFGSAVAHSDVLDVDATNRRATVVADLEKGHDMPVSSYDCVICTQTLMLVYDVRAAVEHLHAALRPGGVLLGSVSGIAQISALDRARTGEYWRLTTDSTRRLLEEHFPSPQVESRGNVLTACAFLSGLASGELTAEELEFDDPRYQLVVLFRAVKPG